MNKMIGGTFLLILCALLGALFSLIGAYAMGLPHSDWSLEPLVYLALGFVTGAIGFLGVVCALALKNRGAPVERMGIAAVAGLFLAFLSGIIGYPITKCEAKVNMEKSMAESAASNQRYEDFYSMLRKDPEVSLRESWYKTTDERRDVYRMSIRNQDIAYSPSMLGRLYTLDGQMTLQLLRHPSLDASLLESEFHRILKRLIRGVDCDKMQAILCNPNAKDEWFAEVVSSGIIEKDICLCSDSLGSLVARHQVSRKSDQTVPPNKP